MALALLIAGVSVAPHSNYKIHISNKRAIDRSSAVRLVAKNLGTSESLQMDMHDRILGFIFRV